jgi:hypothetical protein
MYYRDTTTQFSHYCQKIRIITFENKNYGTFEHLKYTVTILKNIIITKYTEIYDCVISFFASCLGNTILSSGPKDWLSLELVRAFSQYLQVND